MEPRVFSIKTRTLKELVICVAVAGAPLQGAAAQETVVIETTAGEIVVALDSDRASRTASNFLQYVDAELYTDGRSTGRFDRTTSQRMTSGLR